MIVGIVGSRRRNAEKDKKILYSKILDLIVDLNWKDFTIVTGDCKLGGDKFARELAFELNCNLKVKRVNLPPTGEYFDFVNAYYKRNEKIAKEPLDYLIAIVAEDRKGGTENTIKHFKKYHKDWEDKLIIL